LGTTCKRWGGGKKEKNEGKDATQARSKNPKGFGKKRGWFKATCWIKGHFAKGKVNKGGNAKEKGGGGVF